MASVDVTRIASNIGALNALNSLTNINKQLAAAQTKLSTGKRINSAADDPAGLTIATKMLARSEGMKVALDNIGDAQNMLSVAESGMSKMNDILVQMRSKAEQAASDTLGSSERQAIQTQLSAYSQQIQDLVDNTKWNGVKLLDQTSGTKTFQTGADSTDNVQWALSDKLDPTDLGVSSNNTVATTNTGIVSQGASITGATSVAAIAGLTALDTGGYTVKIDDAATAASGKVNVTGTMTGGVTNITADGSQGAAELASGNYTFQVTGGTDLAGRTNVDYRILDSTGAAVYSATGVNMSAATYKLLNGTDTGVQVSLSGALTSGTQASFEYIAHNHAKYELDDSSGVAQNVSVDGVSSTTGSSAYFSAAAAGTIHTGRGFDVSNAIIGSITKGDSYTFNYEAAGNYVVDVSSASKASAYMDKVNTALDTVNKALSNLGSLMARLSFKEDATSTAQVNVEASYNRIMNANMAEEQVNASKFSILQQTATAMLAQANTAPQSLLTLFR